MALIHEKIKKADQSLYYLNMAKQHIEQYRLDGLQPYFAIRMASWQRIFGNESDAIFYAGEALRKAPIHGLKLEEAIGHMLMTFLLPVEKAERLDHCTKAITLYNALGDHTGSSAMFHQLSKIYYARGKYRSALSFNDSSIAASQRSIASGNDKHENTSSIYSFRGKIYKDLKINDSAWFYLNKGHEMKIGFMQENIDSKIAEIDTRYNIHEKQQKIEQQRKELQRRNLVLSGAGIVLILMTFLLYSLYRNYRKQQAVKWTLARQKKLIEHQADQLQDLDAAKTRFFANISHELRTPLTLIMGPISKLINESKVTDKQLPLLRMVSQSGTELSNLVNQILDLGKIDAGKMVVRKMPAHLTSFFRTHLAHFDSLAQRKKISYLIMIDNSLDLTVLIDREKYRMILYNLLSNAFKFIQDHGTIQVLIRISEGRLELRIYDSGPGIDPDEISQLFDRYFQSSRSNVSAAGGTGIGLALCQEYTHLLGGEISVSSTLGEGTAFEVSFPIEIAPSTSSEDEKVNTATYLADTIHPRQGDIVKVPLITGKPTILVVEDNIGLQSYIQLILSGDYNVMTAGHGKEALEMLNSAHYDLILSDLMMPIMDGYELLRILKSDENKGGLPIIMLTARAEMDDKLKALRIGVDDYLTKPFDEQELKARINNLLNNSKARRNAGMENSCGKTVRVTHVSAPDRAWLEKFEEYIRKNYGNEYLSVPVIA